MAATHPWKLNNNFKYHSNIQNEKYMELFSLKKDQNITL